MSEHRITMTEDEVKALGRGKTMHRILLDPQPPKLMMELFKPVLPYKPGDVLVVQAYTTHANTRPRLKEVARTPITAVRAERVQEITHEDIHSEGIRGDLHPELARIYFAYHWNTRHPKTPFKSNPFVVAISFEAVGL